MYQINFKKPIHIHFIGIGGISMSGLAELLLQEGFRISGSDNKCSELTENLEKKGAKIFYGQRASNIQDDLDLVVYTAAIHADNPEYAEVIKRNLPKLTRAELLGQIHIRADRLLLIRREPLALDALHVHRDPVRVVDLGRARRPADALRGRRGSADAREQLRVGHLLQHAPFALVFVADLVGRAAQRDFAQQFVERRRTRLLLDAYGERMGHIVRNVGFQSAFDCGAQHN